MTGLWLARLDDDEYVQKVRVAQAEDWAFGEAIAPWLIERISGIIAELPRDRGTLVQFAEGALEPGSAAQWGWLYVDRREMGLPEKGGVPESSPSYQAFSLGFATTFIGLMSDDRPQRPDMS